MDFKACKLKRCILLCNIDFDVIHTRNNIFMGLVSFHQQPSTKWRASGDHAPSDRNCVDEDVLFAYFY